MNAETLLLDDQNTNPRINIRNPKTTASFSIMGPYIACPATEDDSAIRSVTESKVILVEAVVAMSIELGSLMTACDALQDI